MRDSSPGGAEESSESDISAAEDGFDNDTVEEDR